MPADSHRERVVAAIRISSQPLDDNQVAARAGISPRQTVNQICRALERAGMVRRRPGPDGKIVNEWLGDQDQDREPGSHPGQVSEAFPVTGALASAGTVQNAGAVPDGDSAEQRGAERVMLDLLGAQLDCELNPATITVAVPLKAWRHRFCDSGQYGLSLLRPRPARGRAVPCPLFLLPGAAGVPGVQGGPARAVARRAMRSTLEAGVAAPYA